MKKIIKKVSAAVIALAVVLTAVMLDVPKMIASAATNGTCGNNLTWKLENGTLTISGSGAMADYPLRMNKPTYPWSPAGITSIVIENGVTSIGEYAFYQLKNVTKVTIPQSVTKIGKWAFKECEALTGINIPGSVESIGQSAFGQCTNLSGVNLSEGIKSIGMSAFSSTKLTGITLPSTVNDLGAGVFNNCSSLQNVNIPEGITKLWNATFNNCAIESITIPSSVAAIDTSVFSSCTKLKTVIIEGKTPPTLNNVDAFVSTPISGGTGKIYVPCGAVDAYKAESKWSSFASIIINDGHKIGADGHIAAKSATCTEAGNIEYWTCGCGEKKYSDAAGTREITNVVIPKTGHNTTGTIAHKDATCTAAGVMGGTYCTVCNYGKEAAQATIAILGHSWSTAWSNDGTNHWHACTRSGCTTKNGNTTHTFEQKKSATLHWQECSVCGYQKSKMSHSWGKWTLTKEPTIKTTGAAERACSCGEKQTKTDVPALTDPVWTKDTAKHVEPTEEAEGKDVYTSADYGTVTVVLPQLDHSHVWGDWTIKAEPTLTAVGTAERICTKNNAHKDTTTLPVLTNTTVWTKDAAKHVEPTEETEGKDVYTNADYGEVAVTLPKLEHTHDWGSWSITQNPTVNASGTAERVCIKNNTHKDTTTLPVLTNTTVWTKDAAKHVDPTEETEGKDVYTNADYGEVTVTLPKLEHTHDWGSWSITQNPTVNASGTAERVCIKNNTHKDTTTLPVLTNTTVWTKDAAKHVDPTEKTEGKDVYASEYGEVTVTLDKLPHTHKLPLTHVPEVKPTEDKEGVKEHWHCEDCGKNFEDENGTKEMTDSELKIGKIETEVQAPANVPKPEIATSKEAIIAAALTDEERNEVEKGKDIKIILKVDDATQSVSGDDKGKVNTAIGSLTNHKLGQYLDIILLKKIGEQEQKITATNVPITITFEIPSALRGKAEYSVIRVHGDETTILKDRDNDANTVTIETDRFSTYALTYQEKATTSKPSGSGSSGGRPSGGSSGSSRPRPSTSSDSDTSNTTSSGNENSSGGDNSSKSNTSDNTSSGIDFSSGDESASSVDNSSDSSSSDTISSGSDISNSGESSSSGDNSFEDNGSETTSSENYASSDGSNHTPSDSSSLEENDNPSTGIAVSLIPLTAVLAAVVVTTKRRRK